MDRRTLDLTRHGRVGPRVDGIHQENAATEGAGRHPDLASRDLIQPLGAVTNWTSELFGDYDPSTKLIRVWMRTAIRKDVTSFGTFLSTLCHEFCHHLDFQRFRFADSWHTRGFYERAGALYHHARGTPPKKLFWVPVPGGRWRIDWQRTNQGGQAFQSEIQFSAHK